MPVIYKCGAAEEWSGMANANSRDWRELCAAAAQESDPDKLSSLVSQIIQAIDEGRLPTSAPDALPNKPLKGAVKAALTTRTVSDDN
jgi:hypothetical protein